jgi:hypothetical protein
MHWRGRGATALIPIIPNHTKHYQTIPNDNRKPDIQEISRKVLFMIFYVSNENPYTPPDINLLKFQ